MVAGKQGGLSRCLSTWSLPLPFPLQPYILRCTSQHHQSHCFMYQLAGVPSSRPAAVSVAVVDFGDFRSFLPVFLTLSDVIGAASSTSLAAAPYGFSRFLCCLQLSHLLQQQSPGLHHVPLERRPLH